MSYCVMEQCFDLLYKIREEMKEGMTGFLGILAYDMADAAESLERELCRRGMDRLGFSIVVAAKYLYEAVQSNSANDAEKWQSALKSKMDMAWDAIYGG